MASPALKIQSNQPSRFVTSAVKQPVRFSGLPENAIQQFFADTAGVYAPKLPYMRSWLQFFEDSFLEGAEDAAWYFIVPGLGPLLAKAFNAMSKTGITPKEAVNLIGQPLHSLDLSKLPAKQAAKLVGAKAGTFISATSLMCAAEYLVQHNKNWLTAKLFGTKNFAAVAGLEQSRNLADKGEQDPAKKASKRNRQVLGALVTALAGAATLSKVIPKSPQLVGLAKKALNWVDFGKGYDVSKTILAMGIGTGVVSYMDAARDNLERKELASRLAIVAPYLMFGKELAGNFVAWVRQGGNEVAKAFDIGDVELANGTKVAIKNLKTQDGKAFTFLKPDFKLLKTPFTKESFLNFNAVKSLDVISKEVASLPLPEISKSRILRAYSGIDHNKFLLCTAVMSAWLALLVNAQTRSRYNKSQQTQEPRPHNNVYGANPFQRFQASTV